MRIATASAAALLALAVGSVSAQTAAVPHLLQQPAIGRDLIAFSCAGDIWTAPRGSGKAARLTTGVGMESAPLFSPDGRTVAFTGEYDGNVDVSTVPAADSAVAWTPDGERSIFRSARAAASRYAQLYSVAATGGPVTPLPLPMAFSGQMAPDGGAIVYSPLAPAFSFDFTSYVAWGRYKGGRAGTVWITSLPGLKSVEIPHEAAADFSPAYLGGKIYFLSGQRGSIGIFAYDPASGQVVEIYHNTGPDIRTLAGDGGSLIFDRLGELYTLDPAAPGAAPSRLTIEVAGDLPDVRPRIESVADQVEHIGVSPTGLRAVAEAHGEILTVPVKPEAKAAVRNLTNTPGVMEREPAWSPDGRSVA